MLFSGNGTFVRLQGDTHRRAINHNTGTVDSSTCTNPDSTPGDCFLTVTRSGTYLVTGQVTWAASATGSRHIDVLGWTVGLSAAFRIARDTRPAIAATAGNPNPEVAQSVSSVHQLTAGQSVGLVAFQDSGGGLALLGGSDPGAAALTLTWLGPGV